jgi:hypothetical protein
VGGKLLEHWRKMFIRILHQEVKNLLQQRGHIGDFRAAFSKRSHFQQGTTSVEEGAQFRRGFRDTKSDERAKRLLIINSIFYALDTGTGLGKGAFLQTSTNI